MVFLVFREFCRGQGVKMIDDCLFCRCRGLFCVVCFVMIDDCLFCRCRGRGQGVLVFREFFLVFRELR